MSGQTIPGSARSVVTRSAGDREISGTGGERRPAGTG